MLIRTDMEKDTKHVRHHLVWMSARNEQSKLREHWLDAEKNVEEKEKHMLPCFCLANPFVAIPLLSSRLIVAQSGNSAIYFFCLSWGTTTSWIKLSVRAEHGTLSHVPLITSSLMWLCDLLCKCKCKILQMWQEIRPVWWRKSNHDFCWQCYRFLQKFLKGNWLVWVSTSWWVVHS